MKGTYKVFDIFRKRKTQNCQHTFEGILMVVDPILHSTKGRAEGDEHTYDTKRSGLSSQFEYSRFGIGSSNDAGSERRLAKQRKESWCGWGRV